jgi:gluconokinase
MYESGGVEREAAVLALDVGTSSVRASVYDHRGEPIPGAACRVAYQVRYLSDGGVEIDAQTLLDAADRALDGCATAWHRSVAAVGISCFWHSLLAVDGTGRPVTPVLMWPDTSYPLAKLAWVRRRRPDWWAAADRWLSFADLLAYRVTGELVSSVSMASGSGLYDQVAGRWDGEVLEALGLRPRALPEVVDLDEASLRFGDARWPGLRGVPVLPPVGDGACNNLGGGCVGPERLALMIGTSAAVRVLWAGGPWRVPESLWQYRLDRRRGLVGGALSNGGNLQAWLRDTLSLGALDGEALDAALDALPPDAHGLTVLPLLAGERSPGWAAQAFGAVVGLRESTTALDLLRAGMEAVAVRVAAVVHDVEAVTGPVARLVATGGALWRSRAWVRMVADAVGRDLERSLEPEASSRGAALLALERLGLVADATGVPAPPGELVPHDPSRREAYARAWDRQRRLYELLRADPVVGFGGGVTAGEATAAAARDGP